MAAIALDVQDHPGPSRWIVGLISHSSLPRQMPRDLAICMNSLSAGTVLTLLIASAQRHELDVRWCKGHHHPVFTGIQGLYRAGPVGESQLPVNRSWRTAAYQGTQDHRIGFFRKHQLQLSRHCLGCLTRSLDDVLTRITGCPRRQRILEGIGGWFIRPALRFSG